MRAPLFTVGVAAGLAYLVPKGLGLLSDLGGSRLNRDPEFSLRPDLPSVVVLALFLGAALVSHLGRVRLAGRFDRLCALAERHPLRAALVIGAASLVVHAILFAPFRLNCFRIPDPDDERLELRGGGAGIERTARAGPFEDNTRNYVTASAVRRLGVDRYFHLHEAPELTGPEQSLCRWALTNHPPGYHLLLAPFASGPVVARATSVVLYAAATLLGFLLLYSLLGAAAAIAGAALLWAVPSNLFFLGMMTPNDLAAGVATLLALVVVGWSARPSTGRLVGAGLLLGAAFLVKYTALLALPWIAILLLWRQGLGRGIRGFFLVAVGFAPLVAGWILCLAGTEWGAVQYERYVAGMASRALDPANVGRATSAARGSTLDFVLYVPVELGFPLAATLLLALVWWLSRPVRAGAGVLVAFLLYGISFLAAFLVVPKTNYIFFALPGLVGLGGAYLSRSSRREDAVALLAVVVAFAISRTVLYGIQTW